MNNTSSTDCYKSIDSPGTGTIDFWDVNKIDTATGQVYSIMATQDSSISIGNPVLSPKHPSLLCIDMIDYTASVLAVNLYTGKSAHLILQWLRPSLSRLCPRWPKPYLPARRSPQQQHHLQHYSD